MASGPRTASGLDFAADVRAGLCRAGQKTLPCRYFYDELGSLLFEAIGALPEYGLTRAGGRLLRRHAPEIAAAAAYPAMVAELGSGNGKKTRWLLEALRARHNVTYFPIDISPSALARSCEELGALEGVRVAGLERTYLDGLREAAARRDGQNLLVLFLGSTIGNFDPPADEQFLRCVRGLLAPGDALLLATDLVKPVEQTLAAYDDSLGVTAAFNLNLLARINRELDSDFDLTRFRHLAVYNREHDRVEMYLRSLEDQCVHIRALGLAVRFQEGETIWTENSHKYTVDRVQEMASRAGFTCAAHWVDQEWPFAQSLLKVE